jgi:hypothetical protein
VLGSKNVVLEVARLMTTAEIIQTMKTGQPTVPTSSAMIPKVH